jgi:steroid delta-isomerase-like uncharacterized protein
MSYQITRRALVGGATAIFALPATAAVASAPDIGVAASVVEAYLAAWNAHDAAAAAALLAEDVTYVDASVGTITGREAAREKVIAGFLNAAPDARWEVRGDMLATGDRVAFEWTFSGTNTGAWADGTPATGKAFSFNGATVITVKDYLIATQADYYDALGFYKQLGLM